MSPTFVRGRVSRLVASRLAAGVLPSVLPVGLLIGLFHYGKGTCCTRRVPRPGVRIDVRFRRHRLGQRGILRRAAGSPGDAR